MSLFPGRRAGWTRVEVLALMAVVGLLIAVGLPACQGQREEARRNVCVNNLKQLGVALHNHHDAQGRFPPSSEVRMLSSLMPSGEPAGTAARLGSVQAPVQVQAPAQDPKAVPAAGSWSWLSKLLPFLKQRVLYDQIDFTQSPWKYAPAAGEDKATLNLVVTTVDLSVFRCPNYTGPITAQAYDQLGLQVPDPNDPTATRATLPARPASTNYVTVGASTYRKLFGVPASGGQAQIQALPDGVLYPGSRTRFRDIPDGSSNTILLSETREPIYNAWAEGVTASVFALTDGKDGTGVTDSDFAQVAGGTFLNVAPRNTAIRTTLNFGPPANGNYLGSLPGNFSATSNAFPAWQWGPSSEHAGLVIHLFADSAVRPVPNDIDCDLYFHLVTRSGRDPVGEFFRE